MVVGLNMFGNLSGFLLYAFTQVGKRETSENKQPEVTPFYFKLLIKPTVQELLGKREWDIFQVVKNNLFYNNDSPNNL